MITIALAEAVSPASISSSARYTHAVFLSLALAMSAWTMGPLGAAADIGWDEGSKRLLSCPYESNCVSSNYLEPPNRYVSPLKTNKEREVAFAKAIRDLSLASSSGSTITTIVDSSPSNYYIHLTVPGTAPNSLDDMELVFVQDGEDETVLINLRCQSRVVLPPPPFCVKKNCINGNMDQRGRVDSVARILGMPYADGERMQQGAKWTPIFFNSDRVPGFDDEI